MSLHFYPKLVFSLLFCLPGYAEAQPGVTPRAVCQSTCTGNLGENIFPNGDFGSGIPNVVAINPGFAPGYNYQVNPPPNDGGYTIANSSVGWGSFAASTWIKIQDNGPEPNGYMMVVNASYTPGLFFLKKVPVCENTLYEFSIDIISMNTPAPGSNIIQPKVAFEIDSVTVCETNEIPIDVSWHTIRFSFSTGPGVSQVTLGLRNNAPGGYGNDLAIDNISFRACGPNIDVPATVYFCAGQPVTLNATLSDSPYPSTVYQWQTQAAGSAGWQNVAAGTGLALPVPQPVEGDQYRLLVASAAANLDLPYCRAVSQPLELMLDDVSGFAIGGTDTILCNGAPAVLDAGPYKRYKWSTGATTANIEAPAPGWYTVTVTTVNDCPATDSLFVYAVDLTASAEGADPHCAGDSSGWIRAGNVQGGAGPVRFSLDKGPEQDQAFFGRLPAGPHTVTVRDSLGCHFDIAVPLTDPPPVLLSLGDDRDVLVCDSLELAVQSNFPLTSYWWQPSAGLSCTACPVPMAMPMQTTVYTLSALDERGCPGADSIRITVLPRLDVYAPNVFRQDISENGPNNSFTLFLSKSAVRVRRLAIFDRWGELVFQRENEPPGSATLHWDGTDFRGRPLDEGVFVWQADIEFTDGGVRRYAGDVTLLSR